MKNIYLWTETKVDEEEYFELLPERKYVYRKYKIYITKQYKKYKIYKVDEEEYFELLPERTHLMLLTEDQLWSPNISLQG